PISLHPSPAQTKVTYSHCREALMGSDEGRDERPRGGRRGSSSKAAKDRPTSFADAKKMFLTTSSVEEDDAKEIPKGKVLSIEEQIDLAISEDDESKKPVRSGRLGVLDEGGGDELSDIPLCQRDDSISSEGRSLSPMVTRARKHYTTNASSTNGEVKHRQQESQPLANTYDDARASSTDATMRTDPHEEFEEQPKPAAAGAGARAGAGAAAAHADAPTGISTSSSTNPGSSTEKDKKEGEDKVEMQSTSGGLDWIQSIAATVKTTVPPHAEVPMTSVPAPAESDQSPRVSATLGAPPILSEDLMRRLSAGVAGIPPAGNSLGDGGDSSAEEEERPSRAASLFTGTATEPIDYLALTTPRSDGDQQDEEEPEAEKEQEQKQEQEQQQELNQVVATPIPVPTPAPEESTAETSPEEAEAAPVTCRADTDASQPPAAVGTGTTTTATADVPKSVTQQDKELGSLPAPESEHEDAKWARARTSVQRQFAAEAMHASEQVRLLQARLAAQEADLARRVTEAIKEAEAANKLETEKASSGKREQASRRDKRESSESLVATVSQLKNANATLIRKVQSLEKEVERERDRRNTAVQAERRIVDRERRFKAEAVTERDAALAALGKRLTDKKRANARARAAKARGGASRRKHEVGEAAGPEVKSKAWDEGEREREQAEVIAGLRKELAKAALLREQLEAAEKGLARALARERSLLKKLKERDTSAEGTLRKMKKQVEEAAREYVTPLHVCRIFQSFSAISSYLTTQPQQEQTASGSCGAGCCFCPSSRKEAGFGLLCEEDGGASLFSITMALIEL
ncbi:unnamed protein product, partial [Chrysoparadoxa australica]